MSSSTLASNRPTYSSEIYSWTSYRRSDHHSRQSQVFGRALGVPEKPPHTCDLTPPVGTIFDNFGRWYNVAFLCGNLWDRGSPKWLPVQLWLLTDLAAWHPSVHIDPFLLRSPAGFNGAREQGISREFGRGNLRWIPPAEGSGIQFLNDWVWSPYIATTFFVCDAKMKLPQPEINREFIPMTNWWRNRLIYNSADGKSLISNILMDQVLAPTVTIILRLPAGPESVPAGAKIATTTVTWYRHILYIYSLPTGQNALADPTKQGASHERISIRDLWPLLKYFLPVLHIHQTWWLTGEKVLYPIRRR